VAANAQDEPVGFAAVIIVDDAAHLEEIDVHPAHGRQGLGRRLVETVCAWAREHHYPAVTLTTFRDIPWNAPFYARLGFRILDKDEWTPGLRAISAEEAQTGLDPAQRVCMRRDL
jgi:GNAT superfamily N-acetyltransferase